MTREQYSAQLMREALDAGGSTELVLTHFLDHISDDESTQLRKVLQRSRTRKTKP